MIKNHKIFVQLTFRHRSFNNGVITTAIIAVDPHTLSIRTFENMAKERLCNKYKLDKKDVVVINSEILGTDVEFVF